MAMPKSVSASVTGSNVGTHRIDPQLVGETNEVKVCINDIQTLALLDTGSCVSVISESFHKNQLVNIEIQPLNTLLKIECADGKELPYIGYIEIDLKIDEGLPRSTLKHCLFLVSPDTHYSSRVPVIIGTNILQEYLTECKQNFGDTFLQKAKLHTPWYLSLRTMVIREKDLKKNKNKIALIRCAVPHKVLLKPNECLELNGYIDRTVNYPDTTALLHESEHSNLPLYVDVTPAVVNVKSDQKHVIVTLSNLTTNTVVISPKAILCELQPVTVTKEENCTLNTEHEEIIDTLNIDEHRILSTEQREKLKHLLRTHKDIFSTSETDIGVCNKIKHG